MRRNTLCIISLMVGTSSMDDNNPSQHPATFAAIVFLLQFRISSAHRRGHGCAHRSLPNAASSTRPATQILFSASDPKTHILVTSQPANVSRAKRFKVEQRHPCQHTIEIPKEDDKIWNDKIPNFNAAFNLTEL